MEEKGMVEEMGYGAAVMQREREAAKGKYNLSHSISIYMYIYNIFHNGQLDIQKYFKNLEIFEQILNMFKNLEIFNKS